MIGHATWQSAEKGRRQQEIDDEEPRNGFHGESAVFLHTVEVSVAEAEAMGRLKFQGPPIGPWWQHNTSSEYLCRYNQR